MSQEEALVAQLVPKVLPQILEALKAANTQDTDMEESKSVSASAEDAPPQWADVLRARSKNPEHAQAFVSMLASAPPLPTLKNTVECITLYTGVPSTPAARRHRTDSNLAQTQQKLELVMHLLVHFFEQPEVEKLVAAQHVAQASAWIRSAWQDLHEQRRSLFAGRQAWKLDPRPDDTKTRLLSQEEEKRIKPSFRPKPAWQTAAQSSNWQPKASFRPFSTRSFSRGRSRSRDPGRGKGKGKGKGGRDRK